MLVQLTLEMSQQSLARQGFFSLLFNLLLLINWNDYPNLSPLRLVLFFVFFFCFCSMRALRREREFLAKRLTTRLTAEERDALYIKWEVPLEGKQRKIQFVNKLWTNPHDPKHIQDSAEIVAKLVGFREGGNMSREMFELNFVVPSDKRPWIMGWNPISNLLNL